MSTDEALLVYGADERLQATLLRLMGQDAEKHLIDHRIVRDLPILTPCVLEPVVHLKPYTAKHTSP